MEAVKIYREFYDLVKEFNTAMGQAVDKPMTYKLAAFRLSLIEEELRELEVECSYAIKDIAEEGEVGRTTIKNLIKELADLEYVAAGFNVTFGIPLVPVFDEDYDFSKIRDYYFTEEALIHRLKDIREQIYNIREIVKKSLHEVEHEPDSYHPLYWMQESITGTSRLTQAIVDFSLSCGINLIEVFREVHKSNMSKLGDDGKPIYREDGKVIKGPNYKKPDMDRFV